MLGVALTIASFSGTRGPQPVIFVLLFGGAITVRGSSYHQFIMAGIFAQMMVLGASTTAVGVADDLSKAMVDRFRSRRRHIVLDAEQG